MLKKSIFVLFLISIFMGSNLFAQDNSNTINFLKGNISDKTTAVKNASGDEAKALTNMAIEFSLENKEILGNDRELDTLLVAAILTISNDYAKNADDDQKKALSSQLNQIYSEFNDSSTVEIALLNKVVSLKDILSLDEIITSINTKIKNEDLDTIDSSLVKTTFSSLEKIGNTETFIILYYFYVYNKYPKYTAEIENTLIALVPDALNEVFAFIKEANFDQLRLIYNLLTKSSKISKNNLCIISENVLNRSILLIGDSSTVSKEDIEFQMLAVKTLAENKWTRASAVLLSYFQISKDLYKSSVMTEEQFTSVIESLSSITPLDAVTPLTAYLEDLNNQMEEGNLVSSQVLLSVIKTLGAIGDKAAFDSLLAVTYLPYEESVLSAAREALSGLRWQ